MESLMGCRRVEPVCQCIICFAGVDLCRGKIGILSSLRDSRGLVVAIDDVRG